MSSTHGLSQWDSQIKKHKWGFRERIKMDRKSNKSNVTTAEVKIVHVPDCLCVTCKKNIKCEDQCDRLYCITGCALYSKW